MELELPVYHVTLTRDALDKLLTHLAQSGATDIVVNEHGEVAFDLMADQGVDIETLDIVQELFMESEMIEEKQKKLKEGGKRWKELEEDKNICINSAVKVMKLLQKHYDDVKIE